jgi:hypothetical protein
MQSSTNGDDGLMINNGENSLGQNDDGGLSRCISVHESDDESETSSEVIIRNKNFNSNEFCFFYLAFISHS